MGTGPGLADNQYQSRISHKISKLPAKAYRLCLVDLTYVHEMFVIQRIVYGWCLVDSCWEEKFQNFQYLREIYTFYDT